MYSEHNKSSSLQYPISLGTPKLTHKKSNSVSIQHSKTNLLNDVECLLEDKKNKNKNKDNIDDDYDYDNDMNEEI